MASVSGKSLGGYGINYLKVADEAKVTVAAGSRLVVLGYMLNGTGEVKLTDGTTTWTFNFAEKGGASYPGGPGCPAFECAAGGDLEVDGEVTGHLTYVVI